MFIVLCIQSTQITFNNIDLLPVLWKGHQHVHLLRSYALVITGDRLVYYIIIIAVQYTLRM